MCTVYARNTRALLLILCNQRTGRQYSGLCSSKCTGLKIFSKLDVIKLRLQPIETFVVLNCIRRDYHAAWHLLHTYLPVFEFPRNSVSSSKFYHSRRSPVLHLQWEPIASQIKGFLQSENSNNGWKFPSPPIERIVLRLFLSIPCFLPYLGVYDPMTIECRLLLARLFKSVRSFSIRVFMEGEAKSLKYLIWWI